VTGWPVRAALADEISAAAHLWHATWHEAHASIVPAALVRLRTVENFAERLSRFGDDLRVAGPEGAPIGLCAIRGAELDQLFVAKAARGTGLAGALLADGEGRLLARGVVQANLDCARGNQHAARFYERNGWQHEGPMLASLVTSAGPFKLEVLKFRKSLS